MPKHNLYITQTRAPKHQISCHQGISDIRVGPATRFMLPFIATTYAVEVQIWMCAVQILSIRSWKCCDVLKIVYMYDLNQWDPTGTGIANPCINWRVAYGRAKYYYSSWCLTNYNNKLLKESFIITMCWAPRSGITKDSRRHGTRTRRNHQRLTRPRNAGRRTV